MISFERDDLAHPFEEAEEWVMLAAAPRIASAIERCEMYHDKRKFEEYGKALREFVVRLVGEDEDGDGEVTQVF